MTQFSWDYSCSPDTGDAGNLTAEKLAAARMFLGQVNPQAAGVIYWDEDTPANILFPGTPPGLSSNTLDNLLAPSAPGGGLVRIASGAGMALGRLFVNDADVDFDINSDPGQANATDLIVLRRNDLATVAQSIRLARKKATAPSTTAIPQQDGTIWEVPIAEVLLDGSGNLSSVTDVRVLVNPPLGTKRLLERTILTGTADFSFTGIAPLFHTLELVAILRGPDIGSNTQLRFNNDSGNNYDYLYRNMIGDGTTATVGAVGQNHIRSGTHANSSATANGATILKIVVPNYRGSFFKNITGSTVTKQGATTAGIYEQVIGGIWASTAVINRIDLFATDSFAAGSEVSLYGVI